MSKRKKLLLTGAVGVLLVGGVVAALLLTREDEPEKPQANAIACVEDSVGEKLASDVLILQATSVESLEPLMEEIKGLAKYEDSPSCLYVLTIYSINIGDSENSRVYFDKLKARVGNDESFRSHIVGQTFTIDELQPKVELLERQRESLEKNPISGPSLERLEEVIRQQ